MTVVTFRSFGMFLLGRYLHFFYFFNIIINIEKKYFCEKS